MNDQVSKANEFAAAFTAFINANPVVMSLFLPWVLSWVLTVAVRPWIKLMVPDHVERHAIRLFDVTIAALAAYKMWPGANPIIWALCIGGLSPFAYFALSEAICWKLPSMRKYLSLRELEVEPATETGDETRVPPGDTQ